MAGSYFPGKDFRVRETHVKGPTPYLRFTVLVRAKGFEPPTSRSQSEGSGQTELHPDTFLVALRGIEPTITWVKTRHPSH